MILFLHFLSLLSVICRYYRQNSSSRIIVVLVYTVSTLLFVAYRNTEQGERSGLRETYMEVIKKQRLAVCRILLDVVEGACEVRDPDLIMRTRHYPALQREMCFADRDWEEARDLSVLACLVLSKELHYKVKMMIGLVAHDLYSRESSVSYQQRLSFDVLMSAIDWPVSFKEITLFAPSK